MPSVWVALRKVVLCLYQGPGQGTEASKNQQTASGQHPQHRQIAEESWVNIPGAAKLDQAFRKVRETIEVMMDLLFPR